LLAILSGDRERPGNYVGERSAEVGRVGRNECAHTVKLKRPICNDNLFVELLFIGQWLDESTRLRAAHYRENSGTYRQVAIEDKVFGTR